jgi:GGDEF domain-containing protein
MSAQELAIWSMALGAIAAIGLARLADVAFRPGLSASQALAYHATVLLLVLLLSGVAQWLWPQLNARLLRQAQVLAGPVCVALSNFWIRGWLAAAQRDGLMSAMLRASALLLPFAGLACLALPSEEQLPGAAAVSLAGSLVTSWLIVRSWLMGDRLAPVMSLGCLLTLPAIAGLYAVAMRLPGVGWQALLAFCAALANALTGLALWRRHVHQWRSREGPPAMTDPVTRLHTGIALVHKLLKAQRRRRRTRRDGAVLAVMVFDVERIAAQVGTAGVNDMFVRIAARIQRQVGVVNPVGRYYDRCFVTLVEAIQSPSWLRTLGLKVATALRRPIEVTSATGERVDIKADIGVGVVHLSRRPEEVEDILHDAQRMAQAARTMPSRAAMLDPASREVVPVEQANLGGHRARQMRLARAL